MEHVEVPYIKIIVSFKNGFRTYQDTLTAAIRILRPNTEVITVEPENVGKAAQWFGPDVVIGNQLRAADLEAVPAWVELSLDPAQSSKVSVNGSYSEIVNPTLDKLLVIIERVKMPS